jgi:hypothetical protein
MHRAARPPHPSLPLRLVELADVAANGECFWPGDVAPDVARALAAQDHAILGGEVYCRRAVGWAAYLGEWATSAPERADAPWAEHVARGLAEALRAIERDPADWGEPGEPRRKLRFFFAAIPDESTGTVRSAP